jgi:hypothetical protein
VTPEVAGESRASLKSRVSGLMMRGRSKDLGLRISSRGDEGDCSSCVGPVSCFPSTPPAKLVPVNLRSKGSQQEAELRDLSPVRGVDSPRDYQRFPSIKTSRSRVPRLCHWRSERSGPSASRHGKTLEKLDSSQTRAGNEAQVSQSRED